MEWAFDKLGVYDFFNLIFSGGVFVGGLHLVGFTPLLYLANKIAIPENNVFMLTAVMLICYIIGFELQAVGLWIGHNVLKIPSGMTRAILRRGESIIENEEKLKIYQEKANELFKKKSILTSNDSYSDEQCEYFFAYCNYFLQVNAQSKKVERMRGVKGLSTLYMVCFSTLFLIGLARGLWILLYGAQLNDLESILFFTATFLLLAITSYCMMETNTKYWIRMVLGTYDACSDCFCRRK